VLPVRVTKRPKRQRKKPDVQSKTAYSPRPPTSSDRNEILRVGWPPGDSSKVRISSTSVKRFRSCGVVISICPFHWWASLASIQQLVYRTSRGILRCIVSQSERITSDTSSQPVKYIMRVKSQNEIPVHLTSVLPCSCYIMIVWVTAACRTL